MLSGLYLITDDNQDNQLLSKVEAALIGGARIVQYRAKDINPDERRSIAEKLCHLCHHHKAKFIVNDLPELAQSVDADGVHLGQEDMPAVQARQILGRNKIIGISTHSVEEALKAEAQGADYIAIGSIFPTGSKDDANVVGLPTLEKVRRAVRVPLVAIGGMTAERAFDAIEAGADSVAVISAIMDDSDPTRSAREFSLLFRRKESPVPNGHVLSIAGSDSLGETGIQGDIKTITLLGSYASGIPTVLTAQNSLGVTETYPVDSNFVDKQLATVLDDINVDIIKTGMLSWGGIITRVARTIEERSLLAVVDPVMVTKGGESLLDKGAHESLISRLLPQSYLVTPNLPETGIITGIEPHNVEEMIQAGRYMQELGARNVLIKGGHLKGDATDVFLHGDDEHLLTTARIKTVNTQGSGCALSAAIATFIAQGYPLKRAVERAKEFINLALEHSFSLGKGEGPINHHEAALRLLHD